MNALRGGSVLICGKVGGFSLRFLRNVLVARLISVEDFGIAGTLMIAMMFVGMAANLNLDKMVIQDRTGDDPHFVAAVKGLNVLRGLLMAVILYLTAEPVAWLLQQSDYVWAYQCVAVIPLINCLTHPDLQRMQRSMRFAPMVVSDMGSLTLSLIVLWPLAIWLGDFRLMLVLYIVEAAGRTGITHLIAERPFRVTWDAAIARRGIRFGWPLLLSGIISFTVLQGDRIIVANQYGAQALGFFTAALNLTMTPMLQAADIVRTFFLPILARRQDDDAQFEAGTLFTLQSTLCAAALSALAFVILGPPTLALIFGERYAPAAPYVGMLGLAFSIQLIRAGTTAAAIARGQTINQLIGNLFQVVFLPFAVVVALSGHSLIWVLLIGVGGNLAGFTASVWLLKRRAGFTSLRIMAVPYAIGTLFVATLLWEILSSPGNVIDDLHSITAPSILLLALIASCRVMHQHVLQLASRLVAVRSS